jgi:CRP/FNR family transcriptional regulator, cyclic AMP receptor protein
MIEITTAPDVFKTQLRDFFRKQTECHRKRIPKNRFVYSSSERDGMVYFIEVGMVKLVLPTPEGKECLLAIRSAGEMFGELLLSGQRSRLETAIAMEDSTVKQIPIRNFLEAFKKESLLESLVQYLAVRNAEQHEVITAMVTSNSELRLARTLLYLSRSLGKFASGGICIGQKISHLEFSEMIGTTRPRVGIFLKKFRESGLISLTEERCLVVNQSEMERYIASATSAASVPRSGSDKPIPAEIPADDSPAGIVWNWFPESLLTTS